jgi:hypothetical protein
VPHVDKFNRPDDASRTLLHLDNHTNDATREAKVSDLYPYTVSWTAVTTNPVLNDGTLTGYYSTRGALVWCKVELVVGSATTFGSGAWFFSLPFPVDTSLGTFIGKAIAVDSGTGAYPGTCIIFTTDMLLSVYVTGGTFTGVGRVGTGTPIAWTVNDEVICVIEYAPDWASIVAIDEAESG